MFVNGGSNMPNQYNKLVGNTSKYPYLVGITTESGNLGTGILVSGKFVLTCGHVLDDSISVEVVSREGRVSARVQKIDESLDLALLELTQSITAPKAKFTDVPFQPDMVLLAVGVQVTPGKSDELAVAEIELRYRNKNDADGKVLDIQLEGGARPGYSGGPVVVSKAGALLCVGVMRMGGPWAGTANAIGLASIRAFMDEYIPEPSGDKLGTNANGTRRILVVTAILFSAVGTIAGWHYLGPSGTKVTGGTVFVAKPEALKTVSAQPTPDTKPPSLPQGPNQNPKSTDSGNADIKVWVNIPSHVYHCPGDRWYGKTKHGEFMAQGEAQKKRDRPANGNVCR
jgi:Trypsin-like peptidase domain